MLEAAAAPAYKDFLKAFGRVAEWVEDVSAKPSITPPHALVEEFNIALNKVSEVPADVAFEESSKVSSAESRYPQEVLEEARVNLAEGKNMHSKRVDQATEVAAADGHRVDELTNSQRINLNRGLERLSNDVSEVKGDFLSMAKQLSSILTTAAENLSPLDLLRAQRLVGILKYEAESGKKVSEGVSDVVEQTLDMEG